MHNAPGACLNMLLEQCIFKLCSWSILNLEYYPRLLMLREQLLLEHNFGSKSHRSKMGIPMVSATHPLRKKGYFLGGGVFLFVCLFVCFVLVWFFFVCFLCLLFTLRNFCHRYFYDEKQILPFFVFYRFYVYNVIMTSHGYR